MIKVNKEVADRLRLVWCLNNDSAANKVYRFLYELREDKILMQDWLDKNNITIADIEKAFTEGYEEVYEFKVGDVITSNSGMLYSVTDIDESIDEMSLGSLAEMMYQGKQYKLVCKAEDRLDLKEGK